MKCDCCGKDERHEIMYRTLDTRVYCWYCSKRTALCCYDKPVLPTTWFRVSMSQHELKSLEGRGHTREFEKMNDPLSVSHPERKRERSAPKYKARTALNYHRKPKGR